MTWLQQHANLISALASTGMLFIWAIYAWLFYQEFHRQRGSQPNTAHNLLRQQAETLLPFVGANMLWSPRRRSNPLSRKAPQNLDCHVARGSSQ